MLTAPHLPAQAVMCFVPVLCSYGLQQRSHPGALAARCCYIFAMSLIFSTQAQLGMGPWSREWGCRMPVPPIITPPTTSAPPAVSAPDDDDNRGHFRRRCRLVLTTRIKNGYPQARIDHGKAGDYHLLRYYMRHGTFSGATVYIKSASANYHAEPQPVVNNDRQGDEDLLSGRGVKRSRPW